MKTKKSPFQFRMVNVFGKQYPAIVFGFQYAPFIFRESAKAVLADLSRMTAVQSRKSWKEWGRASLRTHKRIK